MPGAPQQRTLLVHLLNRRRRRRVARRPGAGARRGAGRPGGEPGRRRVGVPGADDPGGAGNAGRPAAPGRHPAGRGCSWTRRCRAERGAAPRPGRAHDVERRLVDLRAAPARPRTARASRPASTSRSSFAPFALHRRLPQRPRLPRRRDRPPRCPRDRRCRTTSPATTRRCAAGCSTGSRRCCRGWTDRNPADPGSCSPSCSPTSATGWRTGRTPSRSRPTSAPRGGARRCGGTRRLLDYAVHEGCSARTWLALRTDVSRRCPPGRRWPTSGRPRRACGRSTCTTPAARSSRRRPTSTWRRPATRSRCTPGATRPTRCPAGATCAFLAVPSAEGDPGLRPGDVLVLVDRPAAGPDNPAGGPVEAGDPALRHAVRLDRDPVVHTDVLRPDLAVLEVHWHADDALARPLVVRRTRPRRRAADPGRGAGQRRARRPRRDRRRTSRSTRRSPPRAAPTGRGCRATGVAFVDPAAVRIPPGTRDRRCRCARPARPAPARAAARRSTTASGPGPRSPTCWRAAGSTRTSSSSPSPTAAPGCASATASPGARPSSRHVPGALPARRRAPVGNVAAGRLTHWLPRADGHAGDRRRRCRRCGTRCPRPAAPTPRTLEQVRELAPSRVPPPAARGDDRRLRRRRRVGPGVQRASPGAGGPAPGTRRRSRSTRWPRARPTRRCRA